MVFQSFDEIASVYDEDIYPLNEKEFVNPTVEVLAGLASGTDILELAAGTGRITIPLAKRGFQVSAVDISPAMIQILEEKHSEENIKTFIGDMKNIQLDQTFDLIYLVFNGITYLKDLNEQVDCFKNAARHLKPGGLFLIETFLPKLDKIIMDQTAPYALEEEYIGFDKYDLINQTLTSYQFDLSGERINKFQTKHRYVWPSEMELMGNLAGLKLIKKWGNWEKDELSSEHDECILVWQKPEN
ncbi:methyltransferase domain-containing protein [Jeotgalibaca sp. MA1X17-3]|uniref:class I SAM-dependent methyltransferase n=1 Tax=Jeotgalibaca sp. MA1X17-3 TaxID=2908211 RepID=UPI001F391108|nr:class I SAM-dependent methyltransferase [Jeotgalibaca sp. MA1X17-3]UJF16312.1 methyltransferase domain-containing protein [Jeotgalibaca sp. MA1X17-3]